MVEGGETDCHRNLLKLLNRLEVVTLVLAQLFGYISPIETRLQGTEPTFSGGRRHSGQRRKNKIKKIGS
jgi:hypothetical protein